MHLDQRSGWDTTIIRGPILKQAAKRSSKVPHVRSSLTDKHPLSGPGFMTMESNTSNAEESAKRDNYVAIDMDTDPEARRKSEEFAWYVGY